MKGVGSEGKTEGKSGVFDMTQLSLFGVKKSMFLMIFLCYFYSFRVLFGAHCAALDAPIGASLALGLGLPFLLRTTHNGRGCAPDGWLVGCYVLRDSEYVDAATNLAPR
jgi:hypothetical protein